MFTKVCKLKLIRYVLVCLLLIGMFGFLPVHSAQASTLTVVNTADSGAGSLRQAITDAISGDTITFDASLGSYSTINLFSSLTIDKDLTIDASNLPVSLPIDLRDSSNIQILNSAVTISNLSIQRGYSSSDGGAIWSNGNLMLINSTIKDSHTDGSGGAIFSSGSLTIQKSALYGNHASSNGGAIFIGNNGPTTSVINSTISKNYAQQSGGGLYATGSPNIVIINSTIAQNSALTGSQIASKGLSDLAFENSVVACWFPTSNDCTDLSFPPSMVTNSILGSVGNSYGLNDLAENGGPTETMAVNAASELVDAGDDTVCAGSQVNSQDQRGESRSIGAHCDIGAYEVDYISISGNAGIGEAVLKYQYGLYTTADTNGNYTIRVLPGWSGTVAPSKLGYFFTPAKLDYTNLQSNQGSQNYTATADTYVAAHNSGDTWRVSIPDGGGQSTDDSYDPSISGDGRYVAYWSFASNLVAQDIGTPIVVHDNQTGATSTASVHSDGTPFQENSYAPSISADGRYIAFVSYEWFLKPSVWVYDQHTGMTTGLPFASGSAKPSISADGQYIAYMDNGVLTDGDTNNKYDIFVYDQWSASIKRVSISSNSIQTDGDSMFPAISEDGRYVTFQSLATNLVNGDTNSIEDIFVHDNQTGEIKRVSVNSNGEQANGGSFLPSISADGRYVAFHSSATNLVSNDTNNKDDVFVHDLQTGETTRVSVDSNGMQANQSSDQAHISANGRYVAFRSFATNLIFGDTNNAADIFMYDLQTGITKRVSTDSNNMQANGDSPSSYSSGFSVSENGKYLAFSSDATNLVTGDTNVHSDIFVHETTTIPIKVTIKGTQLGTYYVPPHGSQRVTYALDSGPVKVESTNAVNLIAALRDAWLVNDQVTSFAQLMGLPKEALSDTYYFPAYNNLTLSGQLRIANVDTVATDVTVTIAGVDYGPYHLNPSESVRPTYPLDAGPVVVHSSGGVKIIAALRDAWLVNGQVTSFVQLMGLPKEQLSDTYVFPAYNNVTLSGQLRIGNVDTVATDVTVTIAGVDYGPYHLNPHESVRPTYPLDAGPVIVHSSGGTKIIAALRDAWLSNGQVTSFAQLMGLPKEKLSDTYLFPAYNNVTLSGQLRLANVDTVATDVTVTIAGVDYGPYHLNPGDSVRPTYPLDAGPVVVHSSGNVKIIAALRDAWLVNSQVTSFVQLMGLPKEQLSTTYFFPAYNNLTLSGQLRFAVP